jgi:cytochrome P450
MFLLTKSEQSSYYQKVRIAHDFNRNHAGEEPMSQDLHTLSRPLTAADLAEYSRDPLEFMTRHAQEHGEIVPLQFEGELFCLLTNPSHITEVLKDRLRFIKDQGTQKMRGLLGDGLITSEGDFWQRQRRLTQPMFHQQRIAHYGAVMVDYTQQMLQTWQAGQIVDIHAEMMRLTLNIVMKTIFDRDVSDHEASHIAHALDEAMNWYAMQETDDGENWLTRGLQAIGLQVNATDRRYQAALTLLDQTIYAMIQQRRSSPSNRPSNRQTMSADLLSMLMQVEDADDGSRMSDLQLRDEVATMISAGHETTANTLSWAWMLLAQHPHIYTQLKAKLDRVLQGRAATVEDLPELSYASWIIKETMRLYPTVTDVSREATEDCEIGGYRIAKGTTLIMSQWVMHRNERYFTESKKFYPDRWANDFEKQLPRGVYFPFGDGPRVCIGNSFAMMETVLLLVTIAQQFELSLVGEHSIEPQPSFTLRPKRGIQVLLKPA